MTGPDYPRLVNRDQPLPTLAFLIWRETQCP